MHFLLEIIKETLIITLFVMVMMMIIEYINVKTKGVWAGILKKSRWLQVIFSAFLGVIPGCLGGYIVVSLYTHNLIRFGALLAALIATFGDEAYVLFGLDPLSSVILCVVLFFIAIIVGYAVDSIKKETYYFSEKDQKFEFHENEISCGGHKKSFFESRYKNISFPRAILIFGFIVYIYALLSGFFNHQHHNLMGNHSHFEEWMRYTNIILTILVLFVILTVSDHFLEDHLWGHVIKKHFLKIFLWTFIALLVIHIGLSYENFESWIGDNMILVLFVALLIGIIPESGPHLLFVSLFVNGTIPFSILLANSIVQDGHAALPLFAESKRKFFEVKGIKLLLGILAGVLGIIFNF